jgi:hypothetical protein
MLKAKNLFTLCRVAVAVRNKGADWAVHCAFCPEFHPRLVRAAIERPATMRALHILEALL